MSEKKAKFEQLTKEELSGVNGGIPYEKPIFLDFAAVSGTCKNGTVCDNGYNGSCIEGSYCGTGEFGTSTRPK